MAGAPLGEEGESGGVDGVVTSHCGACHANIKSQRPSGLNNGAWEGQVGRRGEARRREETRGDELYCCSVSSCGLLAAPVCSDQRAVLLPCGPSICPSASSRGACFLRAVTAASDVLSRSWFPSFPLQLTRVIWLAGNFSLGRKAWKTRCGSEAGGTVLLRSVINQSFKVKCSFSSGNSEMCGQVKY